jgi:tetratricopeptide (TPR) repeat protein/predicted Ser/Thr protein kinase
MTTQELFCETCGAANAPSARFCQHCAAPLPVTNITGSLPEQTLLIGRYQLVSRIGQGGMGAVYKASDTRLDDRLVAIKEMSKAGLPAARMEEAEASFEREARLLGKLLHPNLPRIHDHFTENDRSYLVMDFIDGETLEDYLNRTGRRPFPVEQVLDWAEQLCDVLSYLHNHQPPIVFRDLKPANVMISESGHIFLIDFGIARIFKPGQSHDTVALGSPGYAAPEQYGKAQSTPRSDLYSLGALIHCLLTGDDPSERPFFFRSASQANPAVPHTLDALLHRMLEMDAERRPVSAQEVLQALRADDATLLHGLQGIQPTGRTIYTYGAVRTTPSGADLLLEEAHTLYTQKRLSEAEKVYTQALQINTTNPIGWQGRGLTQGLLARHTEALTSFERALQLDPSLVISWNGKGTALSTLQRNKDALAAFEQALKLEPNNASSWNGKGAVLNALGRSKEALDAFDMALRFDPHMAQAWNNKGLVLRQQKRYPEALSAFEMALSYDRKIATSWSGKASVLHDMGKLQESLDAYEQACSCNPALVSAWNGKGSVLYDMGRYRQALQAFQEALNLDKNYAPACYGTGNVYYAQQKLKTALEWFDRAIRADPNYAKAWNRRGNVLNDLGDRQQALNSYDRALRIDPRYASAWNGKAGVFCQLERYTEALQAYEQALRINPNFAQAWNGQGNTYYHLGNYSPALAAYDRAVKLNPQMASAWHNISLVLKRLKRYPDALNAAEKAIQLAPNDPDNWVRKAEALKSLKRSKDARDAEKQAVRLRDRTYPVRSS